MARIKQTTYTVWVTRAKFKKSGQGAGRRVSTQMMNKSKKRNYKKYRGQGR